MTVLNTYLLSLAELSFPNLSWTIMLIWGALDVVHPGCLLQIIQKKNPEFFIILFIHACWFLRYVIYGLFQHHFLLLRRYRKNSSPNARGRCEENQKALCSQSSKKISQNVFLKKTVSGMTRMFSTQLSSTLFVQVIISFLQLLVYQSQRIFTDHIILN